LDLLREKIYDEKKRLFHVMVARARDNVIMLKNADSHCPVDAIIPNSPDMIEIRKHSENEFVPAAFVQAL
jgi:hypothetical protein